MAHPARPAHVVQAVTPTMRRCTRALPVSPAGLLEEGAKLLDVALSGDVVITSINSLKTDNERSERTGR